MIIAPYKRTPEPPTVALLTAGGEVVDERGRSYGPAEIPDGVQVWTSYDDARQLVSEGSGEALCWNGEEIRWRHSRQGDGAGEWKNRPSDVAVIKLPFPDDSGRGLDALATWRDWLRSHRAAPIGTTGSAAYSLLRATLRNTLFCTMGEAPPLLQTMGGRLEIGPAGPGSFTGRLEHWDMPAAYAETIGGLAYGGRWWNTADLNGPRRDPEWWARNGRPTFVRARVRVPADVLSPLIRRPRKRTSMLRLHLEAMTTSRYPAGTTIEGVWTWQEIEAAEAVGGRVVKVLDVWAHLGGQHVFVPWWEAVQDGRKARGLAGALAKMTGNALFGRFCMDVAVQGERTIRHRPKGRRRLVQETLPRRGKGPKPAHDLAETVSGRTRARLHAAMVAAGPNLLSAHTDGLWLRYAGNVGDLEGAGWRQKAAARRLDLLDPQTLRYWPRRSSDPEYVMAGRSTLEAPAAFQRLWSKGGFDDGD